MKSISTLKRIKEIRIEFMNKTYCRSIIIYTNSKYLSRPIYSNYIKVYNNYKKTHLDLIQVLNYVDDIIEYYNTFDFLEKDIKPIKVKDLSKKTKTRLLPLDYNDDNKGNKYADPKLYTVTTPDTFLPQFNDSLYRKKEMLTEIKMYYAITKKKCDYLRKTDIPLHFNKGIIENKDCYFNTLLGTSKEFISALSGLSYNDKENTNEILNKYMFKNIIYLLGVNIQNNNITFKDITADLLYKYSLIILYKYSYNDIINIQRKTIKKYVEKISKQIIQGNHSTIKNEKDIINKAYLFFGYTEDINIYPKGYSLEQKRTFKCENNIIRKQHKNSLEYIIKEYYDKGIKQSEVVKTLNLSKGVVSKWYNKFKSNN